MIWFISYCMQVYVYVSLTLVVYLQDKLSYLQASNGHCCVFDDLSAR